jgi:hypothetical protein
LLDLAALGDFLEEVTGTSEARPQWFRLMIYNALRLTAANGYRPFAEIAAACLPPIAARHGRTATPEQARELGERMRACPHTPTRRAR